MDQIQIEEKTSKGAIHCRIIINILGAPKDYVEKTLGVVLKRFREEKGVDVVEEKTYPGKEQGELFSAFSDLEVLFKDLQTLTRICFDYMPASIEIVKPENFRLPAVDLSDFVNDMLTLLHQIDFKLKDSMAGRSVMERNMKTLLRNSIIMYLGSGSKSIEQISKIIGIPEKQLTPFMEKFSKRRVSKKKRRLMEKVAA